MIAAGRCASYAVDEQGGLFSWGCEQASGHPSPDRKVPTRLETLSRARVLAIAAGEYHAIAATANGPLVAWGAGATRSTVEGGKVPVGIRGLPSHTGADVVALAAGYQHSLVSLAKCHPSSAKEL